MTFSELRKKANEVYPAILVDEFGTHIGRKKVRAYVFYVIIAAFVLMVLEPALNISSVSNYVFQIRGIFFLLFMLWLSLYLLETMYLSYYFKETEMDFAIARIVYDTPERDVTGGFLASRVGQYSMLRLGVGAPEIVSFLKTRTDYVSTNEYMIVIDEKKPYITIAEYARALLHYDSDLKQFLNERGITTEIFYGAISWVAKNQIKYREQERWWSRDNLMRVPSLGRSWSFGQVYLLEKYGHSIFVEQSYRYLGDKWRLQADNVNHIEQVLLKETGSNLMIIGDDHQTAMEAVASLAKEIVNGTVLPALESKRIFVLDGTDLIDGMKDKADFENIFKEVLYQASKAGNVIVVIPNISSFAESASALSSDIADILEEALRSTRLQIIALTNTRGFHETVETNRDLMRHFEKIIIESLDEKSTVEMLEEQANYLESKENIFFTYQSLLAITESADRYFSEGMLSDKASDLLFEITPKLIDQGKVLVSVMDIHELVKAKTGIPQGEISNEEREQLESLEDNLHKRVVGQNYAIKSVADALKRSRVGIGNPNRPLGSFMFLGPTGVGKTETTKALAETYFKNEDNIIRIDMSEYTSNDALEKLIGSFKDEKSGILSSRIRERQYGVLLLDEFEKSSKAVMDLFLQILDEGYFSDGRGEKVNARNLIIITTSNAGSDLIYKAVSEGKDVSKDKDFIVNEILNRGIFRPELLNRFDDIVVFHPLGIEHLTNIAGLMIDRLNKRLENKGIEVVKGEELLNYLVEVGNDPKFGAREMNRAVQDTIEKLVAESIIKGTVKSGNKILIKNTNGSLEIETK